MKHRLKRRESGVTSAQQLVAMARGQCSVEQGRWGEDVAVAYLRRLGWAILERNARPCRQDQRCEIDVIARLRDGGIVFVEVKTHAARSEYASRLWRVNRRKKGNLLRACANWIMHHHWHGNFRFDVIEVYGLRAGSVLPEIDHIENVPLFGGNWRFW